MAWRLKTAATLAMGYVDGGEGVRRLGYTYLIYPLLGQTLTEVEYFA